MGEDGDQFADATDDFPFYDCVDVDVESSQHSSRFSKFPASSQVSVRRRAQRSFDDSSAESKGVSDASSVSDFKSAPREKRYRRFRSVKQQRQEERKSDQTESSVTQVDDIDNSHNQSVVSQVDDSVEARIGGDNEVSENVIDLGTEGVDVVSESDERVGTEEWPASLLVFFIDLMIKWTWFQVKLFMGFVTFPLWSLYYGYMFVLDPWRMMRRSVRCVIRKACIVWGVVCDIISPYVYQWLKDQKTAWRVAIQVAWGFIWAVYVCTILCVLLVWAFVVSSLLINMVVEEPVQIEETLHFDFTQYSPVAYVPVAPSGEVVCGGKNKEMVEVGKSGRLRVIPSHQEMQVEVLLTLPESDYNRNLGIFQVRVDFLSASGKVLASVSRPCMLLYKSQLIRLMLTFLEMVPLATGYFAESQTLHVKMRGFPEGDVPTSCVKVMIEQRAEFRPGGGVPEIYSASLVLESALPIIKRVLWYWRKTIFIWVSLMLFITELAFGLLCCLPMILPRLRARNTANMNDHQYYHE